MNLSVKNYIPVRAIFIDKKILSDILQINVKTNDYDTDNKDISLLRTGLHYNEQIIEQQLIDNTLSNLLQT